MAIPDRLRELAELKYGQEVFLRVLFVLALEERWFDLRHMVQHDMAKAVIADYCRELGYKEYLDEKIYLDCWEEVIDIGWTKFCQHTGITREKVDVCLQRLH